VVDRERDREADRVEPSGALVWQDVERSLGGDVARTPHEEPRGLLARVGVRVHLDLDAGVHGGAL
jgi:hypothetical protein